MDGAYEVLALPLAISGGLFVLIALLVFALSRPNTAGSGTPDEVVWMGGPGHSEHGVSTVDLVLIGRPAGRTGGGTDWPRLAETAEPGRALGGATAGW